jgi:hypothetical protein
MGGYTSLAVDRELARAVCELADGISDGPGVAFARSFLGQIERGAVADPNKLPSPPAAPAKPPRPIDVLTNRDVDAKQQVSPPPRRGQRIWIGG